MTKQELNRDIKRLAKMKATDESGNLSDTFVKEYKRLYGADNEMTWLTAQSIRIMLHLNLRYRIIPLHLFGIYIDLSK
jgi:ABC-type branched-subunit amino acid transport system substrate-binding protein